MLILFGIGIFLWIAAMVAGVAFSVAGSGQRSPQARYERAGKALSPTSRSEGNPRMAITRVNHFRGQRRLGGEAVCLSPIRDRDDQGLSREPFLPVLRGHDSPASLAIIEEWESIEAHQAAAKAIPREMMAEAMTLFAKAPFGDLLPGLTTRSRKRGLTGHSLICLSCRCFDLRWHRRQYRRRQRGLLLPLLVAAVAKPCLQARTRGHPQVSSSSAPSSPAAPPTRTASPVRAHVNFLMRSRRSSPTRWVASAA